MAARRRSKKSSAKRRKRKIRAYLGVEALIVIAFLIVILGWNQGGREVFQGIGTIGTPVVKSLDISDIDSTYGSLMQVKGGKIIGEKNGDTLAFPASLTKIMTVIVAIENLRDLKHEITLTTEMVDDLYKQNAMQAGFQPGETVRAIDLLYGAMLPSGAECCRALCYDIAGSEEAFVELMNEKVKKLGLKNTHFCDSTGLHDPNHYSTTNDMAVILKYAMGNSVFREILSSPWHSTPPTNVHPDGITYYSSLYKAIEDYTVTGGKILGGKTGFTSEAGLCLASAAEIEGREYILVTMGAWYNGENYADARKIYNRLGEAAQALAG